MDEGMTLDSFLAEWNSDDAFLTVHTSGSTGKPKMLRVEKSRMRASAEMTCNFLELTSDDTALLCMPLDFIAGKMMVVRSLVRGMRLISVKPSSNPMNGIDEIPTFAAMVPMQVYNCINDKESCEKLKKIKHLIIGGGAIDKNMAEQLKKFPNAVWSTYGMTETLSHIALRRLNGDDASDFYTPFEDVTLSADNDGCLCIDAPKVCSEVLRTNDIVEFKKGSSAFRVFGRKDNVINSGGIKIQIEEIESVLTGVIEGSFAISKLKDVKYGEIVVLLVAAPDICKRYDRGIVSDVDIISAGHDDISLEELKYIRSKINVSLPRYWKPKKILFCKDIPHTGTGKIARRDVLMMLEKIKE